MAKQYWLGEFYVDLSRNQISQHSQSKNLPPKALLVLTHLAENQGKVVSYDELLDKVWPDSVVTPNTLQRSIAQLRKALGENSKAQGIIKTHSKQGYSLECDVRWSKESLNTFEAKQNSDSGLLHKMEMSDDNTAAQDGLASNSPFGQEGEQAGEADRKNDWIVAAIALIIIFGALFNFYHNDSQLQFSDLRYLTATDKKEYNAVYSPDGQYILFNRYFDNVCVNNIWAKRSNSHHEILLTADSGTYSGHDLSSDGKKLIFIEREDCTQPAGPNNCYNLMSLDFEAALRQPQTPRTLFECRNSAIHSPTWIDDNNIVLLQRGEGRWQLTQYSIDDKSSSIFYDIADGTILTIAYSKKRQLLAVTSLKNDGHKYIELLSPDGDLVSSHQIILPEKMPQSPKIIPNFIPDSEQLIFGFGKRLYTLSYQGDVEALSYPFDESVSDPYFHPDGSRLLLIKGKYDSDVAKLSIPKPSLIDSTQQNDIQISVFERSIKGESHAKFQRDSTRIAFMSERSEGQQLWLKHEDELELLSDFPSWSYVRDIHWSRDNQSLLVVANQQLHQVFLGADSKEISFEYPVFSVFHWDSEKQTAIANIVADGTSKFVEIDLNELDYKVINNQRVSWAAKSEHSPIIFTDHLQRFWQRNGVEDRLIEPLLHQGSLKRFVVMDKLIYGVNKDGQLWSYDLPSGGFSILGDAPKDLDYLTDAKGNELLVTLVIAAKKEVVELAVND